MKCEKRLGSSLNPLSSFLSIRAPPVRLLRWLPAPARGTVLDGRRLAYTVEVVQGEHIKYLEQGLYL